MTKEQFLDIIEPILWVLAIIAISLLTMTLTSCTQGAPPSVESKGMETSYPGEYGVPLRGLSDYYGIDPFADSSPDGERDEQ